MNDLSALEIRVFMAYDIDNNRSLSEAEGTALQNDLVAGCEAKRARLIEAFDEDGDGQLSEEERLLARRTIEEERAAEREIRDAEMIERFDTDNDGELSREEKRNARETFRAEREAEMIERFDSNEDGELSDEEVEAMKAGVLQRSRHESEMESLLVLVSIGVGIIKFYQILMKGLS